MKVKVNRVLSEGFYHINFEVSDFTPDELGKMKSFGIPVINLRYGAPGSMTNTGVRLNKIDSRFDAAFLSETEAKKYEAEVLEQIRTTIQRLRDSQDKFSSSEEVPL